jgi:bacterioferritin
MPPRPNSRPSYEKSAVVRVLNTILERELAGVVRYTHYSLIVYGYSRIPIIGWLREQANESMTHAQQAGELVTQLGEHPSLAIGPLLETHEHEIGAILRESLAHERETLDAYFELLALVEGRSVLLEEYARTLIHEEELHIGEVDKMLRTPGDISTFEEGGAKAATGRKARR